MSKINFLDASYAGPAAATQKIKAGDLVRTIESDSLYPGRVGIVVGDSHLHGAGYNVWLGDTHCAFHDGLTLLTSNSSPDACDQGAWPVTAPFEMPSAPTEA